MAQRLVAYIYDIDIVKQYCSNHYYYNHYYYLALHYQSHYCSNRYCSSVVTATTTITTTTLPYTINHRPTDVICQCGAIVKASYMQKKKTFAYGKASKRCGRL
jgi:hypothetical protein